LTPAVSPKSSALMINLRTRAV